MKTLNEIVNEIMNHIDEPINWNEYGYESEEDYLLDMELTTSDWLQ